MARSFLEENSNSEAIRRAMDSELGWDPELWGQLARELGWAAVHIPEAYGGLGLGHVELIALMDHGRAPHLRSLSFEHLSLIHI